MNKKVLIIGLDCAEPSLVFEEWREELPCLASLMESGIFGPLKSTVPPITVPAWASMLTSKDPGQLGLYGFRNRKDHSYDGLVVANSKHVTEATLPQLLSRSRLTSIMLGVPLTYPPRPIRGIVVSSFLAPDKNSPYTYPSTFKEELDELAGGNYIIDVEDFRTPEKDDLLKNIYDMTDARFKAAGRLITEKEWDFFMMVEMGIDRIHHGFWRYHDKSHRLYEPGHKHEFAIRDYYKHVDLLVAGLIDSVPDGTLIMVVSDHGARTMVGGFAINQWLISKGLLRLKDTPQDSTRLTPDMIDWDRTKAWGEGGYYGRVFFNIRGREPNGQIPPEEALQFMFWLKSKLENTKDENGDLLGTKVFVPHDIYASLKNIPPDLIVYFGDLAWRSVGSVGASQPLHVFENDTGPDDANHAQDGIFIKTVKGDKGSASGGVERKAEIYDIAPTTLDHLGLEIPEGMIGRVIS